MNTGVVRCSLLLILCDVLPVVTQAQDLTGQVDLATLQRAAVSRDARAAQRDLLSRSADLRLAALRDTYRPRFSLSANSSHVSDVTHLTLKLPSGNAPIPPKDRWTTSLDVSQTIYDGGASSRRSALERARLAEGEAGVDAAIEPLRDEVTRTFFASVLLQVSERELRLVIDDLQQLLDDTRIRVREGVALGRDSAAVRAEWLSAQSRLAQLRSQRRAAAANITRLTGVVLYEDTPLAIPDWSSRIDTIGDVAALRARPEFARLDRAHDRLDAERDLASAENRPRVLAFGSTGIGRPGLNQFKPDAASFWQVGVKFEWTPFTWGSAERNRELAVLQQQVLATEEKALAEQLARSVQGDIEERERLRAQIAEDEEIIALREISFAQGEAQRKEGVITAAEAAKLRTDLAEARLSLERHRVEVAQAEARIVTTLGLSPR
ncbi:MAG: hypothetical protein MNPFHGCM_02623 [Gemmatimonadaceae bacterium]|nr:hypothetical protein [Gemmatimonadaceae bacterium]